MREGDGRLKFSATCTTYLGNEDKALRDGGAEDDQHGTQCVNQVSVRFQEVQQRNCDGAWNNNIVNCKPDLLGIIESWDVNFTSFPCKVSAEHQEKSLVAKNKSHPNGLII